MIKNFEEYINEDYFSKLANRKDNGDVRRENEITEDDVMSIFNDKIMYGNTHKPKSISFRKENGKTYVDIDGVFFLDRKIDKIPFQFGKVTGNFVCNGCDIESLEGCPEEVGGFFDCSYCRNIKSLEGCPEIVGGAFICSNCRYVTSLDGCPKEVGGLFKCTMCGGDFRLKDVLSRCNVKGTIELL